MPVMMMPPQAMIMPALQALEVEQAVGPLVEAQAASSEAGALQTAAAGPLVPQFNVDSFQCPLTMEIMTDPVITFRSLISDGAIEAAAARPVRTASRSSASAGPAASAACPGG